jgi:putative sterol carrier protein
MPTKEETIQALEKARRELLSEENQKELKGWDRIVQFHFKDIDEFWHFQVVDGVPGPLVNEESDDADIRIKMDEDTFLGVMNGTIKRMAAFTSGKIKVKASLKDISKLTKFM